MYIIYHKHIGKNFPALQEFESSKFQYSRYMKVVRLSALNTGRLYPQKYNSGSHFCYGLSQTQGQSATWRIRPIKNPNDTIENPTRDLRLHHSVCIICATTCLHKHTVGCHLKTMFTSCVMTKTNLLIHRVVHDMAPYSFILNQFFSVF